MSDGSACAAAIDASAAPLAGAGETAATGLAPSELQAESAELNDNASSVAMSNGRYLTVDSFISPEPQHGGQLMILSRTIHEGLIKVGPSTGSVIVKELPLPTPSLDARSSPP